VEPLSGQHVSVTGTLGTQTEIGNLQITHQCKSKGVVLIPERCYKFASLHRSEILSSGVNHPRREGTAFPKHISFSSGIRVEKFKGSGGEVTSPRTQQTRCKVVFLFLTLIPYLLGCAASLKCGLLSSPSQGTSRLEWWIRRAS